MEDSARPFLAGLLGAGISSSLTPALHMREAREQGLNYVYRVVDTADRELSDADLRDVLDAAQLMGYDGLNVTYPYKQRILGHLDALGPTAERLGAVNTVLFESGRRTGHNTDVTGFRLAMERHLSDVALASVVQLGAGGAGSAVADALLELGVDRLVVVDHEQTRAQMLAEALQARSPNERIVAGDHRTLASTLGDADGLVHCTPTGMAHHPGLPLDPGLLDPRLWVADVVYRPLDTALLIESRARGCRVLHGGYMAVYQAARTFELVTGRTAEPSRMLLHLRELVDGSSGAPQAFS